jgi:molybdopterin-guanine dinucleotide biosynthesis protein A
MSPAPRPLGAILAGGESRRYGRPKALAELGGRALAERVRDALRAVLPDVVLVSALPGLADRLALPARADRAPGLGPLAGIEAALAWAAEEGRPGALCLACDLPFAEPALLAELLRRAEAGGAEMVVPESGGRRGVEPLCAYYSVAALPAIRAALDAGERGAFRMLEQLRSERVPLSEVRAFGDPDVLFFNLNTPDDHARAERLARGREELHATG